MEAQQTYLQSWKLGLVTFSLCLGTFLVALDVNIIGTAVPEITTYFNSLNDASWYATAYLLTITAFQPVMGFLYKSFPIRTVYFSNVFVFEVGSILCAAAPSSNIFIFGRAVAGVGAAGLLQGALAIVGNIVRLERRPAFFGIVISVFGVSICVGPVMGGAFVGGIGWRWCFWINLPIGAVAIITLIICLRMGNQANEYRNRPLLQKLKQMDSIGAVLFLGAVCCFTLATQWGGQTKSWSSADVIGTLVGFAVMTILFGIVQRWRGNDALIPLPVLRQQSIMSGCIFLFLIGMFNYVYSFYLPFYFQSARLVSPLMSGVFLIPFVLSQIVTVGLAGIAMSRWGYYVPYMAAGMILCSIGAGLTVRLNAFTPTAEWAAYLVIAGLGFGLAQQVPYTAAQVVLSEADVPTANALFVFFNQLGGIVAIAIGQNLFLTQLSRNVQNNIPELDAQTVIMAGAANLRLLSGGSEPILLGLRQAYAASLKQPFILALSAACAAVFCAIGMQRLNIKTEAAKRKAAINGQGESTEKEPEALEKHALENITPMREV